MCLGQLARCVAVVGDGTVRVRIGAAEQLVSLLTIDIPVLPGDWLVVHSGYALERISAEEAREAAGIRGTPERIRGTPEQEVRP